MLRQAENKVEIEGILSEINLEKKVSKKDNSEFIGGTITVRVEQKIGDEMKTLEIPVHMFSKKFKNDGGENPVYKSMETIIDHYVSIAAAGVDEADRIRITSGDIRMNSYWATPDKFVEFPRINASFVNRIRKDECSPKARFTTEFVVTSVVEEMNREGEPTGRLMLKGTIPVYGGRVDVVPFYASNPSVVNAVQSYWEVGDTVKAVGKLNFSTETTTYLEEVDFGEPIERSRTVNVSELIITGGSQTPLEGERAFDKNEISAALANRKAYIEQLKDEKAASSKPAPTAADKTFDALGF